MNILTHPLHLQRLEGLTVGIAASIAWFMVGGIWWLFLLLLLLPDVSMLGYLLDSRWGAASYNLVHSYPLAVSLLAVGIWFALPLVLLAALLLLAHIGFDRALGYGLKLDSSFQDTHLGRIGKSSG